MIYVIGWYNVGARLSLSSPSGVPCALTLVISHHEYDEEESLLKTNVSG
jgi:hypothetical protein